MCSAVTPTLSSPFPAYTVLTALLGIVFNIALWRLRIRWEQVTLLVLALNLLPPVSGDYKLLHLVVPIALFSPLRHQRTLALVVPHRLRHPNGRQVIVFLRPDWLRRSSPGRCGDPLVMLAIGIAIVVAGLSRAPADEIPPRDRRYFEHLIRRIIHRLGRARNVQLR